jgi:hypothetical protein
VPASSVSPVPTRAKLNFLDPLAPGELASGASVEFGEIEDYLLVLSAGVGCDSAAGPAPTIWAEDPPRVGLPFTWKGAGLIPGAGVFVVISPLTLPGGIDLAAFGLPIPPGVCFLHVSPFLIVGGGPANSAGKWSATLGVPPDVTLAGGTINVQNVQIGFVPSFSVRATPYLPLTFLP